MPSLQPVKVEPIEAGLDRLHLTELRKRFLQVNAERMQRTRNALNHRQEVFLDALPLLFHCNHPMLPGFVSHATPAGISDYRPSKRDIANGKSLARSFCLTGGHHGDNIWSLFLMGSVGTLAHTTHSDFDVWLCHRPDLSAEARAELNEKCRRISRWAADLRLEVHFFLMNCDRFRAGETLSLDEESSGSAQRVLLLDEFYRTALHIAGRLPLWWFVPGKEEAQYHSYSNELLGKRFIRPHTTLDFGGLGLIPPGEYIGAGVWQLYKAINSPYKSVLKLLTMEAYVAEYGSRQPLALEFKQLVYNGELNIDELDPYLMVYRRIERYLLARNEFERLEFARRCFYFKINKPLSRRPGRQGTSWQRRVLESLAREWGWTENYIAKLDRRGAWKVLDVREERNWLVRCLNASYEALQQFAQQRQGERAISADELHILGRKLQAAFGRRAEKIDCINPGISKDVSERVLRLVQSSRLSEASASLWQLYGNETGFDTPLKQATSPVELLAWCYLNQIIDGHIQFDLSQAADVTETQLRRTLARLGQWLPLPLVPPAQAHFARPAVPVRILFLLNVGVEPQSGLRDMGVHRLSGRGDPLRYGSFADNLVTSIDMLSENSWQEIDCQRFDGKYALLDALQAYINLCMPGSHQAPPELEVDCLGLNHGAVIAKRVGQWFHEITTCYYTGSKPPASRYVFEMGSELFTLQFKGPKLQVQSHATSDALVRHLAEPQQRFSPLVLDSFALAGHPLKLMAKRISGKSLQVFFERVEHLLRLYLVDERGSLLAFTGENSAQLHSLHALQQFVTTVSPRIKDHPYRGWYDAHGVYPLEFYELRRDPHRHLQVVARPLSPLAGRAPAVDLCAVLTMGEDHRLHYSFTCLGQDFTWQQLGQEVFYTVAEFIMSQRAGRARYRFHITDLDLHGAAEWVSPQAPLQTSHYLRVKQDVEHKLMMAARAL